MQNSASASHQDWIGSTSHVESVESFEASRARGSRSHRCSGSRSGACRCTCLRRTPTSSCTCSFSAAWATAWAPAWAVPWGWVLAPASPGWAPSSDSTARPREWRLVDLHQRARRNVRIIVRSRLQKSAKRTPWESIWTNNYTKCQYTAKCTLFTMKPMPFLDSAGSI